MSLTIRTLISSASVVIGLAVAPWPVQAQDHHIVMPPDQVKFGPAPPALPAGARIAAAHSHDGYEETIYGLEGVLTWTIEGAATNVGPGEVLCIPRGAVHHFDNTGNTDARQLAIVTPGILGPDFFHEVAAVLDAAAGGPPNFAALGKIMRRHGLTPAP
jgi:mannose-6-phosphate isomerase-like protein (cupin superfamily)